ncbi:MAG: 5'/3'-nucleotidase SurE [Gemmatimonadetes bacterium]|nr:5'/3'-nucleotidase SurE [Gemmatimonadota bacterium]
MGAAGARASTPGEQAARDADHHVQHLLDLQAFHELSPDGGFDLVVSGIKRGATVGTVAHMSGTVGAAMMGALFGLPAVAASLGGRSADFDYSARFVARFVEELRKRPAVSGIVYSINIPKASEAEIAEVTIAKMGEAICDWVSRSCRRGEGTDVSVRESGLRPSFPTRVTRRPSCVTGSPSRPCFSTGPRTRCWTS